MLILYLLLWLLGGVVGYFLMRQAFLVDFEDVLGKTRAWGVPEILSGILSVFMGPLFILVAFIVKGMSCFEKRRKL